MWRHAVMDRGDRRPARRPAAGGQPPAPASRPGPVTGAAGASCSTRTVAGLRSASRAHAHACWVSPDSSGLGIRCGSLADVYGAQGRARRPWPVELVSPVAGRAGVARPDRCRLARIAARRALIWQPSRRRHGVGSGQVDIAVCDSPTPGNRHNGFGDRVGRPAIGRQRRTGLFGRRGRDGYGSLVPAPRLRASRACKTPSGAGPGVLAMPMPWAARNPALGPGSAATSWRRRAETRVMPLYGRSTRTSPGPS